MMPNVRADVQCVLGVWKRRVWWYDDRDLSFVKKQKKPEQVTWGIQRRNGMKSSNF